MLPRTENAILMLPKSETRVIRTDQYMGKSDVALWHYFCQGCANNPAGPNTDFEYCLSCQEEQKRYSSLGKDILVGKDSFGRNIAIL